MSPVGLNNVLQKWSQLFLHWLTSVLRRNLVNDVNCKCVALKSLPLQSADSCLEFPVLFPSIIMQHLPAEPFSLSFVATIELLHNIRFDEYSNNGYALESM